MLFRRKNIESFASMKLSISSMREAEEFEAVCDGSEVVLTLRRGYLGSDGPGIPCTEAQCETETFISLLNGCGVMGWDGFRGKHPIGILDGEMFVFEASVNDGKEIRASGSQNFPRGLWELRDGLYGILDAETKAE